MSNMTDFGIQTLANAANSYVKVNNAFVRLSMFTHPRIKDRDLTAPPGSPSNGDVYLVATGGTGAWSGKDGNIALYYNGWIYFTVQEGWGFWVDDENLFIRYNGSSWLVYGTRSAAVADLNQTISGTYSQSEVQAISDKVDELLAAMRTAKQLAP